jgi:hypothetical protein
LLDKVLSCIGVFDIMNLSTPIGNCYTKMKI